MLQVYSEVALHAAFISVYLCLHVCVCVCVYVSSFMCFYIFNTCACVFLCGCVCAPTSLWTGVWVQAGGPSERCRHALPGATWGSWCPGNRTSCAEAPVQWPLPSHSRSDRSRLAPATPSDRSLSGRGGDGGEDGGRGRWPRRLGRPTRGRGWAGRREASEVSSWPPPPTRALINLPLSSPSEEGRSEGRG